MNTMTLDAFMADVERRLARLEGATFPQPRPYGMIGQLSGRVSLSLAQRIEARSDETPQAAQPEGQEPDPEGDAPIDRAALRKRINDSFSETLKYLADDDAP